MSELLIAGGTVVTADRMEPADVLIRDGRIAEVGRDLTTDGEVLDATGHWVMPGGIDTHTHLAHPIDRLGITTADDFFTGTVGGSVRGRHHHHRLLGCSAGARRWRWRATGAWAKSRPTAVIDYGFHTIVTDVRDDVLEEVPELIEGGFPSFKVYMTYGDKIVNDDGLLRLLEATGANGGLVLVHCENDCAVTYLINQHLDAGKTGPAFHAPSRPPEVEAEATHRAIMLAGVVDAPLCIAHVTSVGAAGHVAAARERGEPVVAETCPQYLVLDDTVYDPCGGFDVAKFVCSPPMRAAEHRDALWSALASGSIQQVSSDHAPFRYHDQKTTGRDNFTRIPNGLPGIETRLPLVFAGGRVDRPALAPAVRGARLHQPGAHLRHVPAQGHTGRRSRRRRHRRGPGGRDGDRRRQAPLRRRLQSLPGDAGARIPDLDALPGRDHRRSRGAGRGAGQGTAGGAAAHRPCRAAVNVPVTVRPHLRPTRATHNSPPSARRAVRNRRHPGISARPLAP